MPYLIAAVTNSQADDSQPTERPAFMTQQPQQALQLPQENQHLQQSQIILMRHRDGGLLSLNSEGSRRASLLYHPQLPADDASPSLSSFYGTTRSASPRLPAYRPEGFKQAQHDIQSLPMSAGESLSQFAMPVFVLAAPTVGGGIRCPQPHQPQASPLSRDKRCPRACQPWACLGTSTVLAWGGDGHCPRHPQPRAHL